MASCVLTCSGCGATTDRAASLKSGVKYKKKCPECGLFVGTARSLCPGVEGEQCGHVFRARKEKKRPRAKADSVPTATAMFYSDSVAAVRRDLPSDSTPQDILRVRRVQAGWPHSGLFDVERRCRQYPPNGRRCQTRSVKSI
jgi:hypothetical protein